MKLKNVVLFSAFPVLALLSVGCASQTTTASTTTTRRADVAYTEETPRTGSYIRRRYPSGVAPDVESNTSNVRPNAAAAMTSAGSGTGLRGN